MTNLEIAFGGVIIDGKGRILLREPRGHFGGYVWTFSKGRPELDETPEEAALREVREETGVFAEIVARIPGTFAGDTTENIYFLMRPTGRTEKPDTETAKVRWATPDEARVLIGETPNPIGRKRDLAVLEAALAFRRGTSSEGELDED
jgi:8-oxo-dGTP pyrophosphatase MutT (NUDIX family)